MFFKRDGTKDYKKKTLNALQNYITTARYKKQTRLVDFLKADYWSLPLACRYMLFQNNRRCLLQKYVWNKEYYRFYFAVFMCSWLKWRIFRNFTRRVAFRLSKHFYMSVPDTNGYSKQAGMARFSVDRQLFNCEKAKDVIFTGTWSHYWTRDGLFCQGTDIRAKPDRARKKRELLPGEIFSINFDFVFEH